MKSGVLPESFSVRQNFFHSQLREAKRKGIYMQNIVDWYGKAGMTVGIAADHGGFELKNSLIDYLTESGYICKDFGPAVFDADDDSGKNDSVR